MGKSVKPSDPGSRQRGGDQEGKAEHDRKDIKSIKIRKRKDARIATTRW
jgi:hypothetical protein